MSDKKTEIDIVRNIEELQQAFEIRRQEFVNKQNIPEKTEFDGNDFTATHILAKVDGKPAGTLRIRYFKDFVRFERMCVAAEFRKSNLVGEILNFAGKIMSEKGFEQAHCLCKEELVDYWLRNNHKIIAGAKSMQVKGMNLIPISLNFDKSTNHIKITDNPEVLIAPEGRWKRDQKSQNIAEIMALLIKRRKKNFKD